MTLTDLLVFIDLYEELTVSNKKRVRRMICNLISEENANDKKKNA